MSQGLNTIREILFYKHYFLDFFNKQTQQVKEKINYVLYVVTIAERIPRKFFQHIDSALGL